MASIFEAIFIEASLQMIYMFKVKLYFFLIAIKTVFCGCNEHVNGESFREKKEKYKITKVGFLNDKIKESSGLEMGNTDTTFFTMNDDTYNVIYEVNQTGKLINSFHINNVSNVDWEELAKNKNGDLFIGDFGNNKSRRANLKIYIVNLKNNKDSLQTITFDYADQTDYSPSKKGLNYDCEAFFSFKDSLYLFSKNRSSHKERMYVIPAKAGDYSAEVNQTIKLKGMVTAADISPDETKFALLTYGYIYLFDIVDQKINFNHPRSCIKFSKAKQAEGLVFINNDDMLVSNESQYLFLVKKKTD